MLVFRVKAGTWGSQGNSVLVSEILGVSKPQAQGGGRGLWRERGRE